MSDKMCDRETFKKNYTGIYDADRWYDYLVECQEIDKRYHNATYSASYNRQLVQSAKDQAFNRHMRGPAKK